MTDTITFTIPATSSALLRTSEMLQNMAYDIVDNKPDEGFMTPDAARQLIEGFRESNPEIANAAGAPNPDKNPKAWAEWASKQHGPGCTPVPDNIDERRAVLGETDPSQIPTPAPTAEETGSVPHVETTASPAPTAETSAPAHGVTEPAETDPASVFGTPTRGVDAPAPKSESSVPAPAAAPAPVPAGSSEPDATASAPSATTNTHPELDKVNGIPWDARIHSGGRTKYSDRDEWKKKRKPKDMDEAEWDQYVADVIAELKAVMAVPGGGVPAPASAAQPAPSPAPAPAPQADAPAPKPAPQPDSAPAPAPAADLPDPDTLPKLMSWITEKGYTPEQANAAVVACGVPSFPSLFQRPDLIPNVVAKLKEA